MIPRARHPEKILVLGAFGTGNLGDELILDSTIRLLSRAYPGSVVRAFSYDPVRSAELHAVDFDRMPPFDTPRSLLGSLVRAPLSGAREHAARRRRIRDLIDSCDLFVLGGGNLLTDGDVYFLEHFVGQIVALAHGAGKPIALLGTGLGPVRTARGRALLRKLADWAGAATFREASGARAFREMGFEGAVAIGDPVFLDPPPVGEGRGATSGPAAVSLRPVAGVDSLPGHVVRAIELLRERVGVFGLAMHPEQDTPVLERHLGAAMVAAHDSLGGLSSAVEASAAVLGMRLHACILAAVYGRPVIAVPYHHKVEAFATSLELPVLPLREAVSAEKVDELIALALGSDGTRGGSPTAVRQDGLKALWKALADLPFDPPQALEGEDEHWE